MLIKILINFILGYVRVSVEGYYIERFINICTNNRILIWNLKRDKNVKLYLNIGINDFKKLSEISRKTKCKVKIEEKKGMPFVLSRYKKRKIFGIFLVIVVVVIMFSSKYVWNIEVIEENGLEVENIMQDLNEEGLKIGILKDRIDAKKIINSTRLKRNDIAWMGIELKGTNVIVRIVKADEAPEIIDENEYCSIVAKKAGTITKITAQNGTALVKVGDTVKEGDTLIAGWMEGKYTGIRYEHSIGEVEAKVWYTETKKMYYYQEEFYQTGNEETKYKLKLNNFQINLYKRLSKFNFYDTIEEEKKFKIFSNFYLPISLIKVNNKEKEKVDRSYTIEEATEKGIQELREKLDSEIENKDKILRRNNK